MEPAAEGEMVSDAFPPEPTLTVSAVARRMGVAPPTLRTWDRRYGLGPSGHTAGAHRRYTSVDVARLLVMRRLTLEGVSPADAAKIAKATAVQGDSPGPPAQGMRRSAEDSGGLAVGFGLVGLLEDLSRDPRDDEDDFGTGDPSTDSNVSDSAAEDFGADTEDTFYSRARPDAASRRDTDPFEPEPPWRADPSGFGGSDLYAVIRDAGIARGSAGGGRVVALPYGSPQSRGLARAAMSLDTYEITRLIRDALRRDGTVATWTTMVMPVLRALGDRTKTNGDVIEVEHAFSEAVLGALRSVLLDSPLQGHNTSTVLLACADGDYHSLPIHALAAALAERRVSCRMLGSGLPPDALAASVRRTGPSVVVIFARISGADGSLAQILRRQRPTPTVVLAGPGWRPDTVPSFTRSAASLAEAIEEVLLGVHL